MEWERRREGEAFHEGRMDEVCPTCWTGAHIAALVVLGMVNLAVYVAVMVLQRRLQKIRQRDIFVTEYDGEKTGIAMDVVRKNVKNIKNNASAVKQFFHNKVVPEAAFSTWKSPASSGRRRRKKKRHWEIETDDVTLLEMVAAGSFGDVYKGEWYGMTVAVKKPNQDISESMLEKFVVEVDLMTRLHHPNIVVFLGASLEPGNMMLILEFLQRGSLHDYLSEGGTEETLPYNRILKFNIDIARGMRYLHTRANVIQRDLKSRNLLLDDTFNVKICDFGLSRLHLKEENQSMTACGTPYWAAPEVILGEVYNSKADVFSYGIVMWEIITREEPYEGKPGLDIAFAVAQDGLRPRLPSLCPSAYLDLMTRCWSQKPQDRPDFSEILERLHELARENRNEISDLIRTEDISSTKSVKMAHDDLPSTLSSPK